MSITIKEYVGYEIKKGDDNMTCGSKKKPVPAKPVTKGAKGAKGAKGKEKPVK